MYIKLDPLHEGNTSGMSLVCTQSMGFPTYCLVEENWLRHIGNKFTAAVYIYMHSDAPIANFFSSGNIMACNAMMALSKDLPSKSCPIDQVEKPGCDQKGEWEAGKHSEGVVQPEQRSFQ